MYINKKRRKIKHDVTITQSFLITCDNDLKCNNFIKEIRKYYHDIERQIIREEEKYNETHYVFYHGQNASNILLQDVLDILFSAPIKNNFHYIRNPNAEKYKKYENIQHFINVNKNIILHEKNNHYIPDLIPEISDHIIAANVCLYSNYDAEGESSFHYFTLNRSIRNQVKNELAYICKEFNLDFCTKYVDEHLKWLFNEKEGLLLQIFIPKELVDKITYVSQPGGIPISSNIKTSEYIESYIRDINDINRLSSDLIQIRILITKDFILNPNSNIKIIRYTNMIDEKYINYKNKLFNQLTISWLKK